MLKEAQKKSLKRKRAKLVTQCPYCGGKVTFRSADGIYTENKFNTMLYVCSNYPRCDSYVRAIPGTDIPVGSMANPKLRRLRLDAHRALSDIVKTGIMTDKESYEWLQRLLQLSKDDAHIGCLNEFTCKQVIAECEKIRANNEWRLGANGRISRKRKEEKKS